MDKDYRNIFCFSPLIKRLFPSYGFIRYLIQPFPCNQVFTWPPKTIHRINYKSKISQRPRIKANLFNFSYDEKKNIFSRNCSFLTCQFDVVLFEPTLLLIQKIFYFTDYKGHKGHKPSLLYSIDLYKTFTLRFSVQITIQIHKIDTFLHKRNVFYFYEPIT